MNHIGSIQEELDRLTDFVNEEGRLSEPVVDELNSISYQIQVKAEFEIMKAKSAEKKLSDLILRIMKEFPDYEPQFKKIQYETLLG